MRRTVLLICPQQRDRAMVEAAGLEKRWDVRFAGPDLDTVPSFDPAALVAELEQIPADGVTATKDRSALVAAVLAERRGLPGPPPAAVAACQHKPTARGLQARAAPEATPAFAVLGDAPPPFGPPWFVKPFVGRLSQGVQRVDSASALREMAAETDRTDPYAAGWEAIVRLAGVQLSGRGRLAEEVLSGALVTLEGYVHSGEITLLGVTDSVMYPETDSFERFEYPSALPEPHRAELGEVTRRLLPELHLNDCFFNVEFFVSEQGPAKLVEVNTRIASQFAPLYDAVHGRSSYDALFALACGEDPGWALGEPARVAVSYVRRVFEDAFVSGVPPDEPDLEILAHEGSNLSDAHANDPGSYRLAIIYEAGETRAEAVDRARSRAERLRFRLEPPRL